MLIRQDKHFHPAFYGPNLFIIHHRRLFILLMSSISGHDGIHRKRNPDSSCRRSSRSIFSVDRGFHDTATRQGDCKLNRIHLTECSETFVGKAPKALEGGTIIAQGDKPSS